MPPEIEQSRPREVLGLPYLVHGVHAGVPRRRGLPGLPLAHPVRRGWRARGVPEVRAGAHVQAVRDEAAAPVVDLHRLRPSHPPDRRDDLPQVLDLAAPVVLRDLPHVEFAMRDRREAVGARDRGQLQDRAADAPPDPPGTDGAGLHEPLSGEVEADETFIGGKLREARERRRAAGRTRIAGLRQDTRRRVRRRRARRNGPRAGRPEQSDCGASHRSTSSCCPGRWSSPTTGPATTPSAGRYTHRRINHSQRIYVDGDVHTQTIEGFFGHFKTDVRGTHHHISTRWLPGYLNEWVWKWNHRDDDAAMFRTLLERRHPIAREASGGSL